MKPLPAISNQRGFTLLEIAIVMVIIGLLTGGGVSLMKILTERRARNATVDYLQQVRASLISFAVNNGRLPWPDGNGDGLSDNGTTNGTLPYLTLQIEPSDPYKRVLRYQANSGLTTDRATTCAALRPPGLSAAPRVVDADGAASAFSAAAVLVSAGPMDADSDGNVFDRMTSGTFQGNNVSGSPNYLRSPPTTTFDDLTAYIGGNELYGQTCEYLQLAVNNHSGATVWVRDMNRGIDIGSITDSHSGLYPILSGTQIELRSAAGGGGSPVSSSTPPTPLILAGRDATINLPGP